MRVTKNAASSVNRCQALEVEIAAVDDVDGPGLEHHVVEDFTSARFPSVIRITVGIEPRRSSCVCSSSLHPAAEVAHGKTERQRLTIVVVERVYGVRQIHTQGILMYNWRAVRMSRSAKSA